MTLKDKSKESVRLAYSLAESGYYNLAANRFYYSVFQKTLFFAEKQHNYDYLKLDESLKKGTHNSLIHHISFKISEARQKDPGNKKLNDIGNIQHEFSELKKLREKADYQEVDITEEDIEYIKEKLKDFNTKYSTLVQFI